MHYQHFESLIFKTFLLFTCLCKHKNVSKLDNFYKKNKVADIDNV